MQHILYKWDILPRLKSKVSHLKNLIDEDITKEIEHNQRCEKEYDEAREKFNEIVCEWSRYYNSIDEYRKWENLNWFLKFFSGEPTILEIPSCNSHITRNYFYEICRGLWNYEGSSTEIVDQYCSSDRIYKLMKYKYIPKRDKLETKLRKLEQFITQCEKEDGKVVMTQEEYKEYLEE